MGLGGWTEFNFNIESFGNDLDPSGCFSSLAAFTHYHSQSSFWCCAFTWWSLLTALEEDLLEHCVSRLEVSRKL